MYVPGTHWPQLSGLMSLTLHLMASKPVLYSLLVFLLSLVAYAQRNESVVIPGSSLSPSLNRTSWLSPSGRFAFGFYPQGDHFTIGIWLIHQTEKTIIWTANRDDPPVSSDATLYFTKNGTLQLRTEDDVEKNIYDASEPAASAAMLDSGNFVLYKNDSYIIWETFDFPTDTILGGQNLSMGKSLVSSVSELDQSSGRFSLNMQGDGNLVAYPVNSSNQPDDAYWSSETYSGMRDDLFALSPYSRMRHLLALSPQGVLAILPAVKVLANSSYPDNNNGSILHRVTLDADGIFRLYAHHFDRDNNSSMLMEWSSHSNQCEVKGFCGLNSYCSVTANKANCACYPGFNFVNSDNKFLGCYRNFSDDDCIRGEDSMVLYRMVGLENMWWGDYSYSVVATMEEDCSNSCSKDCNCGAVLFRNETCSKFKLPLRYGRVVDKDKSGQTAFFKVFARENHTGLPGPSDPNVRVVTDGKSGLVLILATCLGFISCLCFIFAIYSFLRYKHQVRRYKRLSENANLGLSDDFTLRSFSYDELEKATGGFKEELGRGSFGAVYKGTISGGDKTIAVKRVEKIAEEGQREFQAEMAAIARTHHRNLVRLLGFCIEGSRKLLVYEFMSNGSLADLLFKAAIHPVWKQRVKIALDVARGILYLHEECGVYIIHCNIKPQNILMDDTWTAKISDFGLAKLLLPNQLSRKTIGGERATEFSYFAPEWQKNALISVKSDIYSFGVVLLEVVCCRRSIELNAPIADEIVLSSWVYNRFVAGELDKLVEDENVDFKTLERMVKVGLWCIQEDPALRPSMKNVILMLEGTMDIPVPPSPVVSDVDVS